METLTAQRERLRTMLSRFFDDVVVRGIMGLVRPAVRLSTADARGGTALTSTRLGGAPLLPGPPTDCSWPRWRDRPLDFLGVIDFTEIAMLLRRAEAGGPAGEPGLPAAGSLAFYYAAGNPQPWGDDPADASGWRVLGAGAALRTVRTPPVASFPAAPVGGAVFASLPSPAEPAVRAIVGDPYPHRDVYAEIYGAWAAFVWPDRQPRHQLGGWPVVIERPVWPACARAGAGAGPGAPNAADACDDATAEWRLLLQLDSDDGLGWLWGDTGRLFFSVRGDDARRGAFGRSWLIMQSRTPRGLAGRP